MLVVVGILTYIGVRRAVSEADAKRETHLKQLTRELRASPDQGAHGMTHVPIACVNCPQHQDRQDAILQAADELNLTGLTIIEAVTPASRPGMSPVDCCTLSHLRAIAQMKTHGPFFLVIEDDVDLHCIKWWTTSVPELVAQAPRDWGIIKLFGVKAKKKTAAYRRYRPLDSTVAYIVNTECALRLPLEPRGRRPWKADAVLYALVEDTTPFKVYDSPQVMFIPSDHDHVSTLHPSHQAMHMRATLPALLALKHMHNNCGTGEPVPSCHTSTSDI